MFIEFTEKILELDFGVKSFIQIRKELAKNALHSHASDKTRLLSISSFKIKMFEWVITYKINN